MAEDLQLGEMNDEEESSFPPAERRVFTQPYDLSVQTLTEQWASELLILPEIQREYVWDDGRASRLVESLLLNIPIPVLYLAETKDAKFEIIDGHQRIRSVVRFIGNEFSLRELNVLQEYKGLRFHELPEREQRFLKMRTLRAVVIGHESHPTMKFEIFERLNSGSIVLNAQELRNSLYRGPFNRMLHEIVRNDQFRTIIGSKAPRKRMVDEELTLRFFALHSRFRDYRTPLKRFLNDFMYSVRDSDEAEIQGFRSLFERTIERVFRFVGKGAFRLTNARGQALESAVNRALFDCQMLAFAWVTGEDGDRQRTLEQLAGLYREEQFLDAIRRATGDRARTRLRVRKMVQALERAGFGVTPPVDLAG